MKNLIITISILSFIFFACDTTSTPEVVSSTPTIRIWGDNPDTIIVGTKFIEPDVWGYDSIDGSLTNILSSGTVDTLKAGDYSIVYSVVNSSGVTAYDTLIVTVKNPDGMCKVNSKGQSFTMGGLDEFYNMAKTIHDVNFTYDYWIDTTKVTQAQYHELMSNTKFGYTRYEKPNWNDSNGLGDDYPAYGINFFDAALYCNARSKRDGLDTVYWYISITGTPGNACDIYPFVSANMDKNGYRLATEAEWEFACKGGAETDFFWGADTTGINNYTWGAKFQFGITHAVAQKLPNGFGLYDMMDNVWEWCNDYYGAYEEEAANDPIGPTFWGSPEPQAIIRGGWRDYKPEYKYDYFKSYQRYTEKQGLDYGLEGYTFRCVLPQGIPSSWNDVNIEPYE